jgi:hypothetical protein
LFSRPVPINEFEELVTTKSLDFCSCSTQTNDKSVEAIKAVVKN